MGQDQVQSSQWLLTCFSFGCVVKNSASSISPLFGEEYCHKTKHEEPTSSACTTLIYKACVLCDPLLKRPAFLFESPLNP